MKLFYDSLEDYAFNLQGPIVDADLLTSTLDKYADGDDIYEYICEAPDNNKVEEEEEEYREDKYEQMAARHHC